MEQETINQIITKDMTIGDVVVKYPAVIEPLQEAGVHCVGCHVSYSESLEDGFKGHGMSDEDVDAVIAKLNKSVEEYKGEEGKGVKIIISKENLQFLKGAKLDYVDSLQGAGFKISNPNVKSGCGCGQSFEY